MRVLIAGDFVPIRRTAALIEKGDYSCFSKVKTLVEDADYSVLNFECPVVERGAKPITKVGPNLKCSSRSVEAIKWAGFKCVTLANNHFRDYGNIGVEDTINALRNNNLDYVGGGTDEEDASKVLYKSLNDRTLAIINCCEHEFSIAKHKKGGSNPLNPIKQYNDIKEAKKNANYVIVIVHGGHENYQLPSPRMQETYRFFIDAGADTVINHHQHCYSGYEVYHKKPIFYGLGNFCFDRLFNNTNNSWYEGYMVSFDFFPDDILFHIHPYRQCYELPVVELLKDNNYSENIARLNTTIANTKELEVSFKSLCEKRGYEAMVNTLAPTGNRYLLGMIKRHLIPSFITKKKILRANPYINCESHRDVLLEVVRLELEKNIKI